MHRADYGGDYTIIHSPASRWRPADGPLLPADSNPYSVVDFERHAIVAAVRVAADTGLDDLCWDLAHSAISLFELKGYYQDWRETSTIALAATRKAGNRVGQAAMLYSLGSLHLRLERFDEAVPLLTKALDGFREEGLHQGIGLALSRLAFIHDRRGEVSAMFKRYTQALDALRAVGDRAGEAGVLRGLAKHEMSRGDLESARRLLIQARDLLEPTPSSRSYAQLLHQFAELYDREGQLALARRTRQDVLRRVRIIGDNIGEVRALHALAVTLRRMGDIAAAKVMFSEALAWAQLRGERFTEARTRLSLGELAANQGQTDVAVAEFLHADEIFADISAISMRAETLLALAAAHFEQGSDDLAADCIAIATSLLPGITRTVAKEFDTRLYTLRQRLARAGRQVPLPEHG
jgi:tetratricopeptide (TPR) repeat protein